jgi:hypothetical protein
MPNKVLQIQVLDPNIIAPCGINCSLCRAYIRDRQPCPGCRGDDSHKSKGCITCKIKNCAEISAGDHQFCYSCDRYPCATLLHLDTRYRTRYGVNVIENLGRIRDVGVELVVAEEATRWTCPECGSRLCMHKPQCVNCGRPWRVK